MCGMTSKDMSPETTYENIILGSQEQHSILKIFVIFISASSKIHPRGRKIIISRNKNKVCGKGIL